jgi:F0F1-type ATP synthase membrane subunit a
MLMTHLTFFSALDQFDLMYLFGPLAAGFNNIIFTLLCVFGFLLSGSSTGYDFTNSRVIFFSLGLYSYVRKLLAENLATNTNIYFYYTVTLFGFTLCSNIMGLIPYSLTVTSYFVITLFLSGTSFFGNLIIGIRTHS